MWRAGRGVGAALLALAALLFVMGSSAQSADAGQSDEDEVISKIAIICPDRVHIYVSSVRGRLSEVYPEFAHCNLSEWRLVRIDDPAKPDQVKKLAESRGNPSDKIS